MIIEERSVKADRISLLTALGLARGNTDVSAGWIVQTVRQIAQLWPLFLLSKMCVIVGTANLSMIVADRTYWSSYVLGLALLTDLSIWLLPRHRVMSGLAAPLQMRVLVGLTFLSALFTNIWFEGLTEPMLRGLIGPGTGQAGLGILAICIFGHQRVLGVAYFLATTASVMILGTNSSLLVMSIVLLTVCIATMHQARFDRSRMLANQKEDLRSRMAWRLLNEYEESGRGWFWETDRGGAVTYISGTLARSLGMAPNDLLGRRITDLVVSDNDGDRTLGFHISARTAFSDIPVRVAITSDERWWAISGRPILNEYGHFFGFRGSGSDLTEMKRSQAEVARLAQFDSLTGLANRIQMMRTLELSMVTPTGQPGSCALFLLDLDRFKTVNDTMGHPAGDALLRQVSQRLQGAIGDRGMVGRLGGDEFKVVLPGATDRKMLAVLADAVIASLSQPYFIEGTQVVIGASVGIAVFPDDGATAESLIRNADLALYAAKDDGRGVHRFYSPDMHADAEDRRRLEDDLRTALASGGLDLVYQPVVSAHTEQITGFETLLRWNHPIRGAISPSTFVPIAEETGLIASLGEWVLRTACKAATQWPDHVIVAVNVSPIQFANPALPGLVMSALASAGLPPERLELEITESAFLNDCEATDQMFAQLKAIGVRLALDDFGTGYSSLGYLKKAPFDKIKIDQGFVRGAAINGSRNAAIVTAIVSLAETLGMDTTAEGVETHDELALVRALGCSHIQGYIYGRGMDAESVLARFADMGGVATATGFKSSRPPRLTMLRSVAIFHEGQRYQARIRNIGAGGAMIEGLWNVPVGTEFSVELAAGFVMQATSRWSIEDRMGVQFAREIDLKALQAPTPRKKAG